MRVYIALVSCSEDLKREFIRAKDALVQKGIRDKFPKGTQFIFDAVDPFRLGSGYTLASHIVEKSQDSSWAVGLVQKDLLPLCDAFANALLNGSIQFSIARETNLRNFFSSPLARLLKVAAFTQHKMSEPEVAQAMQLPIRNFAAPELHDLCAVYREKTLEGVFHDEARRAIESLLVRRRPRRRSSYPAKYFVDDRSRHFVFGKEHHEMLPTGLPHEARCELNGHFRFGVRIPTDQHFNVSEGDGDMTQISGTFLNCHDAQVIVRSGRTHLNMFSNDHC